MKIFALKSSQKAGEAIAGILGVSLSQSEERDFEDGEHKIRPLENVRNEEVFVVHSLFSDENESINDKLCRLLFFISALKDASAKSVTAVVPYLCYARKDRRTKFQDPVTIRYIAQLFEAAGTDRILTIDIHNLQAFNNAFRIPADHLEAKYLFAEYFIPRVQDEDLVIMSPDIGGIKRVELFQKVMNERLNKEIPIVFMEKYRSQGVVSGQALVGEVRDKTVIILDDLISTGGTLARAAVACKKSGAVKVLVAATHGIFTGNASENLRENSIDEIVICNTIPPFRLEKELLMEKVSILDVAPVFAKVIRENP